MNIQNDHAIMKALGISELRHLLAHTNKGELTLMVRFGETEYSVLLDAVPAAKEVNDTVLALLFPENIPTVKKSK